MNVSEQDISVVCLLKSPALLKAYALSTLTAPPIGVASLALRNAGIPFHFIDAVSEALDRIVPLDRCNGYAIGLTTDEIVDRIDPRARSYNLCFITRQMQLIRLTFLSRLYSSKYLFRPTHRLFMNLKNVIRNMPATCGERAFRLLVERLLKIFVGRKPRHA